MRAEYPNQLDYSGVVQIVSGSNESHRNSTAADSASPASDCASGTGSRGPAAERSAALEMAGLALGSYVWSLGSAGRAPELTGTAQKSDRPPPIAAPCSSAPCVDRALGSWLMDPSPSPLGHGNHRLRGENQAPMRVRVRVGTGSARDGAHSNPAARVFLLSQATARWPRSTHEVPGLRP